MSAHCKGACDDAYALPDRLRGAIDSSVLPVRYPVGRSEWDGYKESPDLADPGPLVAGC